MRIYLKDKAWVCHNPSTDHVIVFQVVYNYTYKNWLVVRREGSRNSSLKSFCVHSTGSGCSEMSRARRDAEHRKRDTVRDMDMYFDILSDDYGSANYSNQLIFNEPWVQNELNRMHILAPMESAWVAADFEMNSVAHKPMENRVYIAQTFQTVDASGVQKVYSVTKWGKHGKNLQTKLIEWSNLDFGLRIDAVEVRDKPLRYFYKKVDETTYEDISVPGYTGSLTQYDEWVHVAIYDLSFLEPKAIIPEPSAFRVICNQTMGSGNFTEYGCYNAVGSSDEDFYWVTDNDGCEVECFRDRFTVVTTEDIDK